MEPGTLLDYTLRLHGVPIRWTTRIETWEPPTALRRHPGSGAPTRSGSTPTSSRKTATARPSIHDRVRYAIPYGPLGALAHRLFVRRDLRADLRLPRRRPSRGWSLRKACRLPSRFPPMRLRRPLLFLLAASLILAGCGSSGGSGSSGDASSRPAPPKSDFPTAEGHTLAEVLENATPSKLVVSPAAAVFYKGPNRVPFGVFSADGKQAPDAEVALYFTKAPKNDQSAKALDTPAEGPFPARIESIATESAFRSQTTSSEAGAATAVYVSHFDFSANGQWQVAALIREGGKLTGTLLPSIEVGTADQIPQVGQKAPLIHTPTPADVGGDMSKITTRIPPDTQNKVDYADVIGKEPIMLLFATPAVLPEPGLRPGGRRRRAGQTGTRRRCRLHPHGGLRKQRTAADQAPAQNFHLETEPWLFAIDSKGTVVDVGRGSLRPRRNDPGAGEGDRGKVLLALRAASADGVGPVAQAIRELGSRRVHLDDRVGGDVRPVRGGQDRVGRRRLIEAVGAPPVGAEEREKPADSLVAVDLLDQLDVVVAEVELLGEVALDHVESHLLIVAGISAYPAASPCRWA